MLNLEYKNTKGIVTGYHQYKSPFQLIQMVLEIQHTFFPPED
jgi:hypothetical protein